MEGYILFLKTLCILQLEHFSQWWKAVAEYRKTQPKTKSGMYLLQYDYDQPHFSVDISFDLPVASICYVYQTYLWHSLVIILLFIISKNGVYAPVYTFPFYMHLLSTANHCLRDSFPITCFLVYIQNETLFCEAQLF